MCGLIAVCAGERQPTSIADAVRIVRHRGPDSSAIVEDANFGVALGATRLAIRDLSDAGGLPMCSDDGALTLTYNGELYDAGALRARLAGAGHRFRSNSDAETVLRSYEEFGPDCVHHLDGMFAFAIWDARQRSLFMARDHFGIKPLYYIHAGSRFACASEVKSLLTLPWVNAAVDRTALRQYLTFLWVPDPLTMFEGIFKLEAGHCATFSNGVLSIEEYWDLDFPPADHVFNRSEADLVAEFKHLFSSAVNRQMVSDVPVGAFLSSGLDSSSIVATMAAQSAEPVRTFTIAFPSATARSSSRTVDDAAVAARTAAAFGCVHREIVVEPDVVDLLPRMIWHLDEPIADPAAILAYLVNREASKDVTVLLSGVGGDELFAGYRKHTAQYWASAYRRLPRRLREGLVVGTLAALPPSNGTRFGDPVRLARKFAQSASLSADDMFLMNSTYFTAQSLNSLLRPGHRSAPSDPDPLARHRRHLERVSDAHPLNRMLYLDTKTFMTSLNLTYNDKMSMAASTEVRVPFLDRNLVEFMAREVPPNLKLRGRGRPVTKYLLRSAMTDVLAKEVLRRPKAGFGVPLSGWISGDLAPMVNELLAPSSVRDRGWFEPTAVGSLLERHRSGREDLSLQIWALMTFELWQRAFIDGPIVEPTAQNGTRGPWGR